MFKYLLALFIGVCLITPPILAKENIIPDIKRPIKAVVIHHTAANEQSVDQIRRGHLSRGFQDIAYHYVIFPDGRIELGRDLNKKDAGVWGRNGQDWIAIVLVGNLHKNKATQKQFISAAQLTAKWLKKYNLPYTRVYGHKEVAVKGHGTLCPGISMKFFRLQVIKELKKV